MLDVFISLGNHKRMEYIFDIFFEEMFESMDRNGLQTRQSRRDVIDRLNSIITGGMGGQNLTSDECSRQAVLSAIDYHQRHKEQNGNVSTRSTRKIL